MLVLIHYFFSKKPPFWKKIEKKTPQYHSGSGAFLLISIFLKLKMFIN